MLLKAQIKKKNYKNRKQKRHNRPSEIRLSGVQPIMPIKTKKYIIKKVKYP